MSSQDRPKSAFAYVRVSTSEQDVKPQKLQISKFAESRNLDVVDWFEDPAVSGTVPPLEREGFSRLYDLLQDLRANSPRDLPAYVLVYEISRVGRTFWEMLEAIRAVEDFAPILSTSPKESFLQIEDKSIRHLLISILAWAAEQEREKISQRTIEGLAVARKEGRQAGRSAPLGYDRHVCARLGHDRCPRSGMLQLNDHGRQAFQLWIGDGDVSARTLQKKLEIPEYWYAYQLLRNVKKYRDPLTTKLVA